MERHHLGRHAAGWCRRPRWLAGQGEMPCRRREAITALASSGQRHTNKPPLARLLETFMAADRHWSLREPPRRQGLARQGLTYSSLTTHMHQASRKTPTLAMRTWGVCLPRRVFSRGDTVTGRVLSVLQGFLRRKLILDINTKASNNQGVKEKRKPHKPMCAYSTKTKLRTTSALMNDWCGHSATKNGPIPGQHTQC